MNFGPQWLLIGAVAAVGVLHTMVPDHWIPITLMARQRGWSRAETARAALQAGTGHVASTLVIALVVWLAGVTVAQRFGHFVDTASSLALIGFGTWIALSSWRDLRSHSAHGHSHTFPHLQGHEHDARPGSLHGPEMQRIPMRDGVLEVSIFETGARPRFRVSGVGADAITIQTRPKNGDSQQFRLLNRGTYWESIDEIPEPHEFLVSVAIESAGQRLRYETEFAEHNHSHGDGEHGHSHSWPLEDDPLFVPLRGGTVGLTRHVHGHSHLRGWTHIHWHDHGQGSSHSITADTAAAPPAHQHPHKSSGRMTLLLILGSSPMVEGIPAFFAAGRYGAALIAVMAVVFALSTIATYVLLCVYSTAGLQGMRLGALERYGEVLSGALIALVGVAFSMWPVL